jgi:glycosyltransferase involved in cell wall biosynthesis
MMANTPLVSICIPAYNQFDYIAHTVQSAIHQNYNNKEIIIIDDNSMDGTWEKLQEFSNYKEVILIKNESNLGIGGNWNKCIEKASGDYIKFSLGDDIIYPGCIYEMVQVALKYRDAGLIFSSRDFLLSDLSPDKMNINKIRYLLELSKRQKTIFEISEQRNGILQGNEILDMMFPTCMNIIGEPSNVLIKSNVFREVGFFDPSFKQLIDVEMWMRILKRYDVVFINKNLNAWRIHDEQATRKNEIGGWIVPELCMLYEKHGGDLKRFLDKRKYEMFSWYIFMDSIAHSGACKEKIGRDRLNDIRNTSYEENGKAGGFIKNTLQYLRMLWK